jgi:nitroreductase
MDVFEAIFTRHSVPKVKQDDVPRALLERVLAAGAQAPNHHRIYPWRFIVLTGEARNRLGDIMAQSLKERVPESSEPALETERARPLRAPVLIAVASETATAPKIIEIENISAAAAAAQNMLLAAHALGLGAMWRTGPAAFDPRVKVFLGLAPENHLIGFLYIGYPQSDTYPPQRPSYTERTVWME